jgi:hypothetical protein
VRDAKLFQLLRTDKGANGASGALSRAEISLHEARQRRKQNGLSRNREIMSARKSATKRNCAQAARD